MTGALLDWSGVMLPAESELTEDQITQRYGVLMRDAVSAFKDDPSYIVDMAETSAQIQYKRDLTSARREAQKHATCKEEVKALTQEILEERGITPPVRSSPRARNAA